MKTYLNQSESETIQFGSFEMDFNEKPVDKQDFKFEKAGLPG
jgi:hypothetical protein